MIKKHFQKLLLVLVFCLFVIAIVATSAITAFAEEVDTATSVSSEEGITWSFDESTGTLTISGKGVLDSTSVPLESLGSSVQKVIIEDGITSIGKYVFSGCDSLTEIAIPDSVTSIGQQAFYGCQNLTSVTMNGVKSISEAAFIFCSSLKQITMPKVELIGHFAFKDCTSLAEITIPECAIIIDYEAFYGCSSLSKITILSKTVTLYPLSGGSSGTFPASATIYGYAESEAEEYAIEKERRFVNLEDPIEWSFDESSGTLTVSGNGEMHYINEKSVPWSSIRSSIQKVIIEDGVTSLSQFAFSGCTGLTEITIPNNRLKCIRHLYQSC